jgi:Flp pilus assembly pilin Flp
MMLSKFLLFPTPPGTALVVRESLGRCNVINNFWKAYLDDQAQDIAEYAVMLAVILVIVVGTIRLVGTNANNVFSSVASSVQ